MVHQLDLRNHGLDEFGGQPLLPPSRFLWKLIGGDSGLDNRKRTGIYSHSLLKVKAVGVAGAARRLGIPVG